ncbi:MAG: M1 family aminopeptidase [Acidobacteriota bacterium]
MIGRRFRAVFWVDFVAQFKRPLFWVMVILALIATWGLSSGNVTVGSGDSDVGGTKSHVTSMFTQAVQQSVFFILMYSFFFAISCGMPVIRDDEDKIGEILHTTRLKPVEYVWGKFLAPFAAFSVAFLAHTFLAMFFNHIVPNADAEKFRGLFHFGNYLWPAVMFCLPAAIFLAGVAFFIGARWRRPILVFLVPVTVWGYIVFFIFGPWLPEDLSPAIDRTIQALDPSGFRWLNQVWLKVDRGVAFYNLQPITTDSLFVITRLLYTAIGVAGVLLGQWTIGQRLRGASVRLGPDGLPIGTAIANAPAAAPPLGALRMSTLQMSWRVPTLWRQTLEIARAEARNLLFQPGLYLFAPMILANVLVSSLYQRGWLESQALITSGQFAVSTFGQVSFWLVLLLMFYTVESLQRERSAGLAPVYYASPVKTFAVLAGKSLANSLVAVVVLTATFLGGAIALLYQHKTPLEFTPFLVVWGLMLVPTFLLWTSFISFVYSLTANRYASYAIGLGVVVLTGMGVGFGKLTWALNWPLWGSLQWSDISVFEIDRSALVMNRLAALTGTIVFLVLAVRFYPRVESDPQRILHRLAPRPLFISLLKALAIGAVPLLLVIALAVQSYNGMQGKGMLSKMKEYRQKNFITWFEAKTPRIANADLDVTIDPAAHRFSVKGYYDLLNHQQVTLPKFPVTAGAHWSNVHWTLDGKDVTPEDRAKLLVFTPASAMKPGDTVRFGFQFDGQLPNSISRNGGGASEFVMPSSVVLTSFGPTFVPTIGFMEEVGSDDDTKLEPRDYPDDAYVGPTPSAFGADEPFPVRISITGPDEFQFNSVGRIASEKTEGGKRTVVWTTDYPVTFFNIVGGRWKEWTGQGTKLFYDQRHPYNVDEMGLALDAARHYYSEWFFPYPWETLKVSEFASLATYAQGFPTNISFSEGIGFLTQSDAKSHAAFLVTAHESAHQWWGNIINPGKLPGGNILSEGTAHFSTLMLIHEKLGEQARIETMKRLEEKYGRDRFADSERPLVKVDGTRNGDTTVTYDKGGWVFTMLQDLMGREQNLLGIQQFFRTYAKNSDHPVLQDFVATLRPYAPDQEAYDAFVKQWFYEVVVPEYKLSDVKKEKGSDGAGWVVTATVTNVGTGTMPLQVAAALKDRFATVTDEEAAKGPVPVSADYKEARSTVTLAAGEKASVTIRCDFEPDRLVLDPDVRVLQLRRKDNSIYKF